MTVMLRTFNTMKIANFSEKVSDFEKFYRIFTQNLNKLQRNSYALVIQYITMGSSKERKIFGN